MTKSAYPERETQNRIVTFFGLFPISILRGLENILQWSGLQNGFWKT